MRRAIAVHSCHQSSLSPSWPRRRWPIWSISLIDAAPHVCISMPNIMPCDHMWWPGKYSNQCDTTALSSPLQGALGRVHVAHVLGDHADHLVGDAALRVLADHPQIP